MTNAYREGFDYYQDNVSSYIGDNPYEYGTLTYFQWEEGYREAQNQFWGNQDD